VQSKNSWLRWQGRLKTRLGIGAVFLLILAAFLGGVLYSSSGEVRVRTGTAIGLGAYQSDFGNTVFVLITTEEGRTIRAKAPPGFILRKGAKVLFAERTTHLFGVERYDFSRWLDEGSRTKDRGDSQPAPARRTGFSFAFVKGTLVRK